MPLEVEVHALEESDDYWDMVYLVRDLQQF